MDGHIDVIASVVQTLSLAHSLEISQPWKHGKKYWQKKKTKPGGMFLCFTDGCVSSLKANSSVSFQRYWILLLNPVVGLPLRSTECLDYCLTTILPRKLVSQTELFGSENVQRLFFFFFLDIYNHLSIPSIIALFLTVFLYQLRNKFSKMDYLISAQ